MDSPFQLPLAFGTELAEWIRIKAGRGAFKFKAKKP